MNRALKIALVSASLLFCGVTAGTLAAAADEPNRAPPARPAAARPAPAPRANAARPTFDGRGQVLDSRYNHGRYYPPAGTARAGLPEGYRPYFHGGNRYYFSGGVWYAPRGAGFVVIAPPVGLVVGVLPPYYSTVWFGGVPYYYADNVYYTWQPDQNGYAVANPPSDPDAPPDAPAPPPPDQQPPPPDSGVQNDLMIYPKNGQTKEQESADQFECNNWAKGQTGFDPTQPEGGSAAAGNPDVARSNYDRAMSACLQGRGYQVN
jgi:hypothetical protein